MFYIISHNSAMPHGRPATGQQRYFRINLSKDTHARWKNKAFIMAKKRQHASFTFSFFRHECWNDLCLDLCLPWIVVQITPAFLYSYMSKFKGIKYKQFVRSNNGRSLRSELEYSSGAFYPLCSSTPVSRKRLHLEDTYIV